MTSIPVADNDVLSLNVGRTLLTTKRSTLTQVHLCLLEQCIFYGTSKYLPCVLNVWTFAPSRCTGPAL